MRSVCNSCVQLGKGKAQAPFECSDRRGPGPLGRRMAATILARWATTGPEDPLLVLLRAAGERGETAELLAEFLDRESLEPLRRQLLAYGMVAEEADRKARGVDVFLLGVSARHRLLRRDLGDAASEEAWIARTVQAIVDAP